MVDSDKIKNRMKELGVSQEYIARKLKIATPTVSQKINNVRPMWLSEAEVMSEILGVHGEDFMLYFFKNKLA